MFLVPTLFSFTVYNGALLCYPFDIPRKSTIDAPGDLRHIISSLVSAVMLPIVKNIFIAIVLLMLAGCASLADRFINRTVMLPPYNASHEAESLHKTLLVVDLHSDVLLWNRDLLKHASYGHVDLPRLLEGHVALQVFSVVTKVPLFLKLDGNSDSPDVITCLTWLQGWPREKRTSLFGRVLYQTEKLKDRIRRSQGALKLIRSQRDLQELLTARAQGDSVIGAMLSLEGAHALEGDIANLDRLFNLGFRCIGLAHFFDNAVTGSAHGKNKGGLTPLGREVVARAQNLGIVIDLAHASPQAIDDTLAIVNKPVIVSHTGVRGTCDSVRNLADRHVKNIAATGGVIGIGLFEYATCGKRLEDTVKAMRYVADMVGVEHIALGSDFDGSTTVVDASGLVLLTEAMLNTGFSAEEIAAILGGNILRVLRHALPENNE